MDPSTGTNINGVNNLPDQTINSNNPNSNNTNSNHSSNNQ